MKKELKQPAGAAADEKLFEMLKELRQKEAKKKSLASICYFPGNILAGYGNHVSDNISRTGKMPGCKQGKGDALWKTIC